MAEPTNTNPGWTPDIARALVGELRKLYDVQRETVLVMRDLRDELERLRTTIERLNPDESDGVPPLVTVARIGG